MIESSKEESQVPVVVKTCRKCLKPGEFRPNRHTCIPCERAVARVNAGKPSAKIKALQYGRSEAGIASKRESAKRRAAAGYFAEYNVRPERKAALSWRRKKIKETPFSIECAAAIAAMFSKSVKCYYCGLRFGKKRAKTLDHIQPISVGGAHKPDNFVICCARCNSSKGARDPLEWAARIGLLLI